MLQQVAQAKSRAPGFEFLIVGDNPRMLNILSAMPGVCGGMNCASSANSALDHIARNKVDGIVIDMSTPGAMDLLNKLRRTGRGQSPVVFACNASPQEAKVALLAGANFILNEPLESAAVAESFRAASRIMAAERRRLFRYPLMLPVELKLNGVCSTATLINLSEGGMAIWSLNPHSPETFLEFAFVLPFGGGIHGEGEIAWTGTDGSCGVRFQLVPDDAYVHLFGWLSRRDQHLTHRHII